MHKGADASAVFLQAAAMEKRHPHGMVFRFPADCLAPAGVSLIPTQLFFSSRRLYICNNLFILQRNALQKEEKGHQELLQPIYLMLYAVGRFLIEFLRNDPRGSVGVLSTSQFIAIFMFAAGAVMLSRFVKNSN